jgi:hypothetical protein
MILNNIRLLWCQETLYHLLQVTPHKSPFEKGGASVPFQGGEKLLVGLGPAQPGGALLSNSPQVPLEKGGFRGIFSKGRRSVLVGLARHTDCATCM